MEKKSFFESISEIRDNFRLYLETHISYYGLTALQKAIKILTALTANGFVLLLFWLSLIFFSWAGAIYLGTLLESTELGFVIMGGFYFILGIVFFLLRHKIFGPMITRILVNILFKDEDDEETDDKQ